MTTSIMRKVNIALLFPIMAVCYCGCEKAKIMAEYGIGKTFSSRPLKGPSRTEISTDEGQDVIVMGHHDIVYGKKVILTHYDNEDKYVCVYGEPNCWKTQDSRGTSPSDMPNKYMNGGKE